MFIIIIGLAVLGFLCFIANMLPEIGKVVIVLIKYIIAPLILLFVISCIFKKGL